MNTLQEFTQKLGMALLILTILFSTTIFGQQSVVDFRYSPANYLAALCFPDDWQKSLINEKGELAYDFGPGPYVKPLTTIGIRLKEKNPKLVKQYFDNPRIPIAVTEWAGDGLTMRQEAFALLPNIRVAATRDSSARVRRLNGLNGAVGWAAPEGVADPAFRNAAWGVRSAFVSLTSPKPVCAFWNCVWKALLLKSSIPWQADVRMSRRSFYLKHTMKTPTVNLQ
ncbi:hypothetical protein HUU40_26710 [candidate division KSB1 bacterium]|nr:hypothetical protein [candidate division KSB1 bacterium]